MTPPDSGAMTGWRCGCGAPISKAQAGCERWPDCMKKPDSDEREVCGTFACPICGVGTPHAHDGVEVLEHRRFASHGCEHPLAAHNYAWSWSLVVAGCRTPDCKCNGNPALSIPLSLAQRILAALEAATSDYERLKVYGATPIRAVIAELRAHLPKEPK